MPYPILDDLPPPPPGKTGWPWTVGSVVPEIARTTDFDWPRISIITPSYNQAEFLEETIRSVLLQRYPNLEYIIIDGGSTDASVEIIRRYAPWLADWVSEPDSGQSQAINKGAKLATGHLLAWLNSDDVYFPNTLLDVASEIASHRDVILLYGTAKQINRAGSEIGMAAQVGPFDQNAMVRKSNLVPQPSAFFIRTAFEAVGGVDEEFHIVMDWDLWLKLNGVGPVRYVPRPYAMMRLYPEIKTFASGGQLYREIKKMVERHGGHGLPTYFKSQLLADVLPKAFDTYCKHDPTAAMTDIELLIEMGILPDMSTDDVSRELADWVWRVRANILDWPQLLGFGDLLCDVVHIKYNIAVQKQAVRGRLYQAGAFESYQQDNFQAVLTQAWRSFSQDPVLILNKGLWSIAIRSAFKRWFNGYAA